MAAQSAAPLTSIVFPVVAAAFALAGFLFGIEPAGAPFAVLLAIDAVMITVMLGAIFAAVHHADVIASRLGEPGGTLVLTLAVTVL